MTERINTYFAVLLVTVFGAGASLLIIHVAYANHPEIVTISSLSELPTH